MAPHDDTPIHMITMKLLCCRYQRMMIVTTIQEDIQPAVVAERRVNTKAVDDETNDMILDCDKLNEDDDIRAVPCRAVPCRAVSPFRNNNNDDGDRDDEYDDAIRMAPPVSFSPTQSEVTMPFVKP